MSEVEYLKELRALLVRCKKAKTRDAVSACTATGRTLGRFAEHMGQREVDESHAELLTEMRLTRDAVEGNKASSTSFDDKTSVTPPVKRGKRPPSN